ncbi:MAG: sugar ABC transporter substrate-binding protein, partial [Oxalobacteraceae bacterium]
MNNVIRRRLLISAALLPVAAAFPSGRWQRAHAQPASRRKRVALVMKTLTNPFFVGMESGARQAEAALDFELLVKTAAQETSIEQQVIIVEGLIRAKVDAIVISPGDSFRLVPILKKAHDAGIVVINVDNRLDPDFAAKTGFTPPFVGVDNKHGAADAV